MVLEFLISPRSISEHPSRMFFRSALISSVAIFVAYYIFPSASSIISLFFITLAMLPTFYRLIVDEEEILEERGGSASVRQIALDLFERNHTIISSYFFMFLGITFAYTFWYVVLPTNYVSEIFGYQISTIKAIRSMVATPSEFLIIFLNNFKVATIAFMLSFFFGTSALFVIAWNASIVAAFFGELGKSLVSSGMHKFAAAFYAFLIGGLSIMIHGIPEILAYFVAGIAGGVLSVGIYRGKYTREIMEDAFILYSVSIALLLIAAFLEAYITPLL